MGTTETMDPFDKPSVEVVRFLMYRNLNDLATERPLPFGYRVEPWCKPMLPAYAATMAVAFSDSPDLKIYRKLDSKDGCISIIKDIVNMQDFFQAVSWIVFFNREPCAFILTGMAGGSEFAQIQAVGVAPRHRRIEIGTHLVNMALWAFRDRRLPGVMVKLSRSNRKGIRFFRSLDFHVSDSMEYL